jgi:hypothetical protein
MKFEIGDVRGLKVVCTEDCWDNHILDEHPIMNNSDAIDHVIDAIQNPLLCIFQDRDFPERHIYYRRNQSGLRYTKAVVDFSNPQLGEVITAFYTDSMKTGEKIIWP